MGYTSERGAHRDAFNTSTYLPALANQGPPGACAACRHHYWLYHNWNLEDQALGAVQI